MKGLILSSVLLLIPAAAALAARDPHPVRAGRRVVALAFLFQAAWLAAVHVLYPRL